MDANEQTETYLGPWPCGFRQEDVFYVFPIISQCKYCNSRTEFFWPQCHNWNRLGRRLLGNASYKASRFNTLCIFDIFFFSSKVYFSPLELDTCIKRNKTI